MLVRTEGRAPVVVAALAIVVAAYITGSVIGRAGEPERSTAPAGPTAPAPTEGTGGAESAGGAAQRATSHQPVTGPGNPPLANSGSGPFGSRRTTGDAYVALTFDDGPDPRWTPEVLQLLRDHNVRATFCVIGELAAAYPELVRQIVDDGHTMCNHSWRHDFGLGNRSREHVHDDLRRTNDAIYAAAPHARVSYYRQPGGNWTPLVVEVAEELGMSSLHWDVDPQDWREPGAGAIASTVTAATRQGSIVLLHDGGGERQATVRALRTILPNLTSRLWLDALPPGVDQPRLHGRELPLRPGQV